MGTVKYSGPIASFHCPTEATIRSLKVHFSPKQEGSGTPSPDNVREIVGWDGVEVNQHGRNLYSRDNVIPHTEDDEWNCIMGGVKQKIPVSSWPRWTFIAPAIPNITYYWTASCYEVGFLDKDKNILTSKSGWNNTSVKAPANAAYVYHTWIKNESLNQEQLDVAFKSYDLYCDAPPTVFEPQNSKKTNYEFGVLGKNKFSNAVPYKPIEGANNKVQNKEDLLAGLAAGQMIFYGLSQGGSVGTEIGYDTNNQVNIIMKVSPNATYCFSGSINGGTRTENFIKQFSYYDTNFIKLSTGTQTNGVFTVPNDSQIKYVCVYVHNYAQSSSQNPWSISDVLNSLQIELGSTATTYEPYNPNHAVYGGWVDLISGEVCEEYEKKVFDGSENWQLNAWSKNGVYIQNREVDYENRVIPYVGTTADELYCNMLQSLAPQYYISTNKAVAIVGGDFLPNYTYLLIYNSEWGQTIEEYKTAIKALYDNGTPLEVVAKCKTDYFQYYNLPPYSSELKTFLGHNNVWSNADYVEVEYDLHETQDILARKQFIIANQPHVEEASGAIATFNTDMAAKLKECKVGFKPKQDLHGYDKPWVGGSGKNLFNAATSIPKKFIDTTGNINVSDDWSASDFIKAKAETTYALTAPTTASSNTARIAFYDSNQNLISTLGARDVEANNNIFTAPANTAYIRISVRTETPTDVQLEEDSAATAYEPWENVCPISGWTEMEVYRTGKNIFPSEEDADKHPLFIRQGTQLTASSQMANGSNDRVVFYAKDKTTRIDYWTLLQVYKNSLRHYRSFTMASNANPYPAEWFQFAYGGNEQQIEFGTTATDYEPYSGTTIPITFPSEVGTIYGGYVDLVSGEVHKEWEYIELNSPSQFNKWNRDYAELTYLDFYAYLPNVTECISNITLSCANRSDAVASGVPSHWVQTGANAYVGFMFPASFFSTHPTTENRNDLIQEILNISTFKLAYKTNKSLVGTLTPVQLKTLRGTNNIWSNANGDITAQFWKH